MEVLCVKTVKRTQKLCVLKQWENPRSSMCWNDDWKIEVLCYISALNQHNNNLFSSANQNDHSTTNHRSSNPKSEPSIILEVLIHSFSIHTMICTTLILWYLHVNDVQNEKQVKSERLTWSVLGALSGCLWMFWVSKRDGRVVVSFCSKGRTKVCFYVWEIWIFMKVSQLPFLSFGQSLSSKASPLNVWWSQVFIDEFVVTLGGKTNRIWTCFGILFLCFFITVFVC